MKKNNLTTEFATRKKIDLFSSIYNNLPDPDKLLKSNGYNFDFYRDLLTDPHLSATFRQRKSQVMQMGWEIENIEDNNLKNELIDWLSKLNLNKIYDDILDALLFGFSVIEIIWEIKDNKFVPVDLIEKPQEWFIFDKNNTLKIRNKKFGYYEFAEGEDLPDYKFILVQNNPDYNNPYGERLLSKVYWPVMFKRASFEKWHNYSEKFGTPFLLGYYSDIMTEQEKNDLLDKIEEAIENNIALIKQGTILEFKESMKYQAGDIFENMIELQNKEISKAVLGETLTIEVERSGSYKAAEIHKEMLEYLGLSDKKLVEAAFNTLIKFYMQINYGKDEQIKFKLNKKESIINASEKRDKILSEMGIKFTKEYFKKRYNLSDKDFEII
ncbi:MAG: DUF935 family protein [Melioribacter sp.]|nr:DUF935 family protein [Melioribacter sp.]